jgi:hypothetical protein
MRRYAARLTKAWRQGLLELIAVLVLASGCGKDLPANVPGEILGTWHADHPKYANLYLQIGPNGFAFSTAEGTVEHYTLSSYERAEIVERRRKLTAHHLRGTRPEQQTELVLYYDPSGGGILRFANRPNIHWTRGSAAAQ